MKMYFRIEAVSCLLERGDFQSPMPCALSGSFTLTIRIVNVARLLERQKGWLELTM